jgi:hypothetical protein
MSHTHHAPTPAQRLAAERDDDERDDEPDPAWAPKFAEAVVGAFDRVLERALSAGRGDARAGRGGAAQGGARAAPGPGRFSAERVDAAVADVLARRERGDPLDTDDEPAGGVFRGARGAAARGAADATDDEPADDFDVETLNLLAPYAHAGPEALAAARQAARDYHRLRVSPGACALAAPGLARFLACSPSVIVATGSARLYRGRHG